MFEQLYQESKNSDWAFHFTDNPFIRFIRDRRLQLAIDLLKKNNLPIGGKSVLVLCGGVGGEAHFLKKQNFSKIVNSDISDSAIKIQKELLPDIDGQTINIDDTGNIGIETNSFDYVLVQDGLHHLKSPVFGFNEMLRIARIAAIVIEPADGFLARKLGSEYEYTGNEVNYVFRWNKRLFEQVLKSQFPNIKPVTLVAPIWDHNLIVSRIVNFLPSALRLFGSKLFYGLISLLLPIGGNNIICIALKNSKNS